MYRLVSDLSNEKYLKQFFPETSASINGYSGISGKRLIPLLRYYVDKDLEFLEKLAKCVESKMKPLNGKAETEESEIEEPEIKSAMRVLDWLLVFKNNEAFTTEIFLTVNNCDVNSDSDSKAVVLEKSEAVDITEFTNEANLIFSAAYEDIIETANNISKPEEVINQIQKKMRSLVKVKADGGFWGKYSRGWLGVSANEYLPKGIDFPVFMKAIQRIAELKDSAPQQKGPNSGSTDSKSKLYTVYIHQLVIALEALGFQVDDRDGFQKFKSSSLFLASLVEASNLGNGAAPKAVAGVIGDFVDEDEVYKNKRNTVALYTRRTNEANLRCGKLVTCENTWFVGSYYGFSMGELRTGSDGGHQVGYRAFGPVGIEFKLFSGPLWSENRMNSTVTFMVAPFDIGVYITKELKGLDYDVNFDDIEAPSYFFSFSSRESPMSIQVGYQKDIPITNNEKDNMWFVAFSYDLPLFTIW